MQNNTTQHNILDKIKEGKIKMKPRAYFVAQTVFFALGVVILLLFLIYLASFIVFSLRVSGVLFLPGFGFSGVRILFGSLPWLLIFLAAALIVLLEFFAEQISFVYKRPAIYSLLAIIAIIFIAGLLIGFSSLHTQLFRNAREGSLPLIGPLYSGYGAPRFHNIHNGIVVEIIDSGFIIQTPNAETLSVIADENMKKDIQEGDMVLIVGERMGNVVEAVNLREVDEDTQFFPGRPMMHMPFLRMKENLESVVIIGGGWQRQKLNVESSF